MEKQVLSIKQMRHLQELGVDTSKAKMAYYAIYETEPNWYNEIYSKTIKDDFYEYNISYQNVSDNKYSFVAYGYKNGELKRQIRLDNIQYLHELQNVFFFFYKSRIRNKTMKIIIKLILLIIVLTLTGTIICSLFPSLTKGIALLLIALFIYALIYLKN